MLSFISIILYLVFFIVSISQDYALIDVWQTKQRFEEEVILCQKEMMSFMKSLKVTEGQLLQDEKVSGSTIIFSLFH